MAWGCTNVHDDSADLYVEEMDPARPDHYRTAEGWERLEVRTETNPRSPDTDGEARS